jgi:hypothetical protein
VDDLPSDGGYPSEMGAKTAYGPGGGLWLGHWEESLFGNEGASLEGSAAD